MALRKNKDTQTNRIDDASLNFLIIIIAGLLVLLLSLTVYFSVRLISRADIGGNNSGGSLTVSGGDHPFYQEISAISPSLDDDSIVTMKEDEISAKHGIIISLTDNKVIASRQSSAIIYPASMTKVMTLIVVAENLKSADSLNDIITIKHGYGENSGYGFKVGEKLTVQDLMYAAILRSDGVACLELADYIAGSEAAFVKMMNAKARELGLGEKTTNFQNCTGLHHDYHYSTSYDIAIIMAYAVKNFKCYEILSSLSYRPTDSFRPGEGSVFWHMMIHERLGDGNIQPNNAVITAGKTGFTDEAEQCLVTYARGEDGKEYIVVTAEGGNVKTNHIDIYNQYVK